MHVRHTKDKTGGRMRMDETGMESRMVLSRVGAVGRAVVRRVEAEAEHRQLHKVP